MAESPEESPLPKGTTLRESVFFCFHFPQQPKHSCFTIMCHKWTQKIKYLKSSRFFVRNAWMWNMSWRCEFCLQIKKIHQTKKCIKFVNRSLRNHLLKSPLKGIHIHIHRCRWHRRRIIGVFFLGTEEKCIKRGTPRYKTVTKSMASIAFHIRKLEKHLHFVAF